MEWEVVIGLETHTQLQTKTKIFSGASTLYGQEPNTQACVLSTALPGVLPVLNKAAVECAIKFGLAINAEIPASSVFSRKNYFYPDLPKGYQISQFELPVVSKGAVTIQVPANGKNAAYEKVINITRAHLEEDAGKSVHGLSHQTAEGMSGIDLNRAGTPLLEIVTEPDMRSAAEAVAYAKKLHELVQWIGICDGNMQEGSFRCDVNVSVRPKGSDKLGTRREIKNLNSFKFMMQAIEYETRWQIETLEDGGKIQQATVLFNPDTGETKSMRSNEEANDYRYFPDPDLLPLVVTETDKAHVKANMPELPEAMKARFESDYGLSTYDAAALTAFSLPALNSSTMAGFAANTSSIMASIAPLSDSCFKPLSAIIASILPEFSPIHIASKTCLAALFEIVLSETRFNNCASCEAVTGESEISFSAEFNLADKVPITQLAAGLASAPLLMVATKYSANSRLAVNAAAS